MFVPERTDDELINLSETCSQYLWMKYMLRLTENLAISRHWAVRNGVYSIKLSLFHNTTYYIPSRQSGVKLN